jgi:hypothetical protein
MLHSWARYTSKRGSNTVNVNSSKSVLVCSDLHIIKYPLHSRQGYVVSVSIAFTNCLLIILLYSRTICTETFFVVKPTLNDNPSHQQNYLVCHSVQRRGNPLPKLRHLCTYLMRRSFNIILILAESTSTHSVLKYTLRFTGTLTASQKKKSPVELLQTGNHTFTSNFIPPSSVICGLSTTKRIRGQRERPQPP